MVESALHLLGEKSIPGAIFFVSAIASFFVYERLVKRQYAIARDAWEADDRPPGFAWAPPATSTVRSWTRGKAMWRWTWSTPAWIQTDPTARALQVWLRVLWATGAVAWAWLGALLVDG